MLAQGTIFCYTGIMNEITKKIEALEAKVRDMADHL
jgi:hypothetical protein